MFKKFSGAQKTVGRGAASARQVYKRLIIPQNQRRELLCTLERNLVAPGFFDSLPKVAPCVGIFDFKNMPVAIKDTSMGGYRVPIEHGFGFEEIRSGFLAHQRALRSGEIKAEHYVLRTIKVYGRIKHFLIMEYISHKRAVPMPVSVSSELTRNFGFLKREGLIRKETQRYHYVAIGNTNPLVVFLAYDYS